MIVQKIQRLSSIISVPGWMLDLKVLVDQFFVHFFGSACRVYIYIYLYFLRDTFINVWFFCAKLKEKEILLALFGKSNVFLLVPSTITTVHTFYALIINV